MSFKGENWNKLSKLSGSFFLTANNEAWEKYFCV